MKTIRLFILGKCPTSKRSEIITVFAEFGENRAISRHTLTLKRALSLNNMAQNLRGFVEAGYPEFDENSLQNLGNNLFDIVIHGSVKDLFVTATLNHKEFLPLELLVESPEMASWPWEYMFDRTNNLFICREFHPVSRRLLNPKQTNGGHEDKSKLQLLIINGARFDDPEVSAMEEQALLKKIFESVLDPQAFHLSFLTGQNPNELHNNLISNNYDIVHYIGHAAFDISTKEGYLKFTDSNGNITKLYANDFARIMSHSGVSLAFLNACETARAGNSLDPSRSSIAAALIDRGISAVIANQFSIPDNGAHSFAGKVYNAIFAGKTLGEAVRAGRVTMCFNEDNKFFDWGIPVLYANAPHEPLFTSLPKKKLDSNELSEWGFDPIFEKGNIVIKSHSKSPKTKNIPKITDYKSKFPRSVAIVDVDSRAGFLPSLIDNANSAQSYYEFRVVYMPFPAGYMRSEFGGERTEPQLFIPRISKDVKNAPTSLGVDSVCFLTRNMLAGNDPGGDEFWNYFLVNHSENWRVFFASTYGLRDYAAKADCSFAKATLMLCLSGVLTTDERWKLNYHHETFGCLFDFCEWREDIVIGLKKMKFDHSLCRNKIKDKEQLAAIDALIAIRD